MLDFMFTSYNWSAPKFKELQLCTDIYMYASLLYLGKSICQNGLVNVKISSMMI